MSGTAFLSPALADGLDTSRLPRVAGAKEVYASPLTTIYAAPDAVAQTAEAARKALLTDGWLQYSAPNAQEAMSADLQILNFKRGPLLLNVLITRPDGAKTANVNYSAKPLANDLPFPPEASDIAFDPNAPLLVCSSGRPLAATLDFFNAELAALGWSPVATRQSGNTEKAAHAYFARPDHAPLLLVLQRGEDGATKIELKSVPAELLAAETGQAKPAPAAPKEQPVKEAPKEEADQLGDAITKQAQQMAADITAEAMAGAKATKPAAQPPSNELVETLAPLEGSHAPIPVPANAEDLKFDGAAGSLDFQSASNVKSVVHFYRKAMKPLGWKETPSVIRKPNMVELEFSKDDKEVSLTIMRMMDKTEVSGTGEGLINAAEKSAAEPATHAATAEDLEAEESGGLPVPKNHTASGTESTPFRHALNAETPLDLKSVLGFYRQELGKRGWKEDATGARIEADRATLNFVSPDGPSVLTLERKNDETVVGLLVRDQVKAGKSGLLPKPGQVKAMFGNMLGTEVVFSIGKQTVKVAAGAGSKGADGPTLELPPGKYKVSMKSAGRPPVTEEANVGPNEIWGFLAGPGGVLPLQMY